MTGSYESVWCVSVDNVKGYGCVWYVSMEDTCEGMDVCGVSVCEGMGVCGVKECGCVW